jgi:hypothetical protein
LFVTARVVAAERTTDAVARATLLRDAVAAAPFDTAVRVPLFRAEIALDRPAQAIEAVLPVLQRNRALNGLGLSAANRSRLARELAEAHAAVDRLPDAVRLLTIALEGQGSAARAPLEQRRAALSAEVTRRSQNAARQPRVSGSIDQPQIVRPLIPPPAAARTAPATTPARQGGAQ